MKTTVIENNCPHCGYYSDRVVYLEEEVTPEVGDLSLCIKCGEFSEFNNQLRLIKADLTKLGFEEQEQIAETKSAWRVLSPLKE